MDIQSCNIVLISGAGHAGKGNRDYCKGSGIRTSLEREVFRPIRRKEVAS